MPKIRYKMYRTPKMWGFYKLQIRQTFFTAFDI